MAKNLNVRTLDEGKEILKKMYTNWAAWLGVDHVWTVVLTVEEIDIEDKANTSWPTNYKNAKIRFAKDYARQASLEDLEHTMIHELLHLVFCDKWDAVNKLFKGYLLDQLCDSEEGTVDIVCRLLIRARNDSTSNRYSELYTDADARSDEPDEEQRPDDDSNRGQLRLFSNEPDTSDNTSGY